MLATLLGNSSWFVGAQAPTITFPTSLPAGTVGTVYTTTQFLATGSPTITWSVTSGTLPTGLTFSSSGLLSGTPTAASSGSITFTATNSFGNSSTSLYLSVGSSAVVANTMLLSLPTGTATSYPYQFGRVFKQGVIANYPQVLIDGVAQTTQADVKNRWPDGSVKFAILSLIVPSLSTTAKTFTFQNQATVNSTPETKANMLANYDFNCTINATSGGSAISGAPVAARTLLNATSDATLAANTSADSPNSRYWTQGPICTTVILCDHTNKTYDFGTNATYKSLRPIFHVQFWPTLAKYRVRVIVEASDVTKLADQAYDVSLSTGNASPTTVFSQSAVPHALGTSWTRYFWSGTAPAALNHDHNCEYIASTYVIPRFDMAQVWDETKIATQYANWTAISAANKGLYGNGNPDLPEGSQLGYAKNMQATGGRPEVAILSEWGLNALMKGDYRLHEISEKIAEFAAAWPARFREGDNTKKYYDSAAVSNFSTNFPSISFPASSANSGSAIGCPPTLFGRPTNFLNDGNQYMNSSAIAPADVFQFAPPISQDGPNSAPTNNGGWIILEDHIAQPWYVQYLLSGDYFWLEHMQFWASRAAFDPQANTGASIYPRGASLYGGNLVGSVRRMAWMFRNRIAAGTFSVDGSKEKAYYDYLTEDAVQCLEGMMGVTGSGRSATTSYVWGTGNGRTGRFFGKGISPLHNMEYGQDWGYGYDGDAEDPNDSSHFVSYGGVNRFLAGVCTAPFQMGYMLISLTFAKDNGYNVAKIREWAAYYLTEATKSDNTAQLLALLPVPAFYGSYPAFGSVAIYPDGGNYSVPPTSVTIGPPNTSGKWGSTYNSITQTQATASLTMTGSAVSAVTITNTPSGYRSKPSITFNGGTGTAASTFIYNGPLVVTDWVPTWTAAYNLFVDPTLPKRIADVRINSNGATWGTGIFSAAAAQITDVTDGPQAYNWVKTNWIDNRAAYNLPWVAGWAIVPR